MKGKGVVWSGEQISQLKALLSQGTSIEQVAVELRRSESAVLTKAHRLKLIPLTRERRRWSPDEQAELRRLAADGYEAEEIARIMGRSAPGVRERLVTIRKYLGRPGKPVAEIESPAGIPSKSRSL